MSKTTQKTKNIETYLISYGDFDSQDKHKIEIDFDKETITGSFIGCGVWYPIETEKCIEIMENVIQYNRPFPRDITPILNKIKTELSI